MALDRAQLHREDHSVIVFGRLRKGVTLAQAQAEMETIIARLKQQYPGVNQQDGVHVVAFREDLARNIKPGLLVLLRRSGSRPLDCLRQRRQSRPRSRRYPRT